MGQSGETKPHENRRRRSEKREKGIFVRLTEAEQTQLRKLSKESGISVSQLLRTGALGQLDQLPRFRKLPAEVATQLARLDRLTSALWYISQRAGDDSVYAEDIRTVVYEAGRIASEVRAFCQANMARYGTTAQLDKLILDILNPENRPTLNGVVLNLCELRDAFQTGVAT